MRAIEQDRALVRSRVFRRQVAVIQRDSIGRQARAQRKMILRQVIHESYALQLTLRPFRDDDGGCRLNRLRQIIIHNDVIAAGLVGQFQRPRAFEPLRNVRRLIGSTRASALPALPTAGRYRRPAR